MNNIQIALSHLAVVSDYLDQDDPVLPKSAIKLSLNTAIEQLEGMLTIYELIDIEGDINAT